MPETQDTADAPGERSKPHLWILWRNIRTVRPYSDPRVLIVCWANRNDLRIPTLSSRFVRSASRQLWPVPQPPLPPTAPLHAVQSLELPDCIAARTFSSTFDWSDEEPLVPNCAKSSTATIGGEIRHQRCRISHSLSSIMYMAMQKGGREGCRFCSVLPNEQGGMPRGIPWSRRASSFCVDRFEYRTTIAETQAPVNLPPSHVVGQRYTQGSTTSRKREVGTPM
jgi:hypothetical protein